MYPRTVKADASLEPLLSPAGSLLRCLKPLPASTVSCCLRPKFAILDSFEYLFLLIVHFLSHHSVALLQSNESMNSAGESPWWKEQEDIVITGVSGRFPRCVLVPLFVVIFIFNTSNINNTQNGCVFFKVRKCEGVRRLADRRRGPHHRRRPPMATRFVHFFLTFSCAISCSCVFLKNSPVMHG